MSSELDFFAKADQVSEIYREAAKHGRKVGRPLIFHSGDAPAYLRNQLVQLPTEAEWQARLDREAADPIIRMFGPGSTIMDLFYDRANKAHRMSPLAAKVTPDDLKRLWDDYFRAYPVPRFRVGTQFFMAAVAEEAARRGIL
ncbi:hypothetical protein [Aestuariivirga sp.]|uniref:hypothetical protein n=1 Tax=Aestuariivirga sp. TaxID=2650926 RepID=UPI0035937A4E